MQLIFNLILDCLLVVFWLWIVRRRKAHEAEEKLLAEQEHFLDELAGQYVKRGDMLEALEEEPENTLEIIALGPLTNLAVAVRLAPETMKRVKRITVMGSAGLGTGNVTPASEFNIWADPEAAKIVVESGLPLMFVGWDACLDESMLNAAEIERIRASGELGKFAIDCNKILMDMNCDRFGEPCLDMADPAAMAAALCPECIDRCEKYYCEVDTSTGISAGAVLVDIYSFSGKEPNVWICSKLKSQVYKDYIFKTLHA